MRKYSIYVILGLLPLIAITSVWADETPSIEYIRAALTLQKNASIKVDYMVSSTKAGNDKPDWSFQRSYIRTSEVLFSKYSDDTNAASLDIAANEYRSRHAKDGEQPRIFIYQYAGQDFTGPYMFDPVWYPVFPKSLIYWIDYATVSSQQEKMENYDCWRLTVENPNPMLERYVFWLDSEIGFLPRGIDLIAGDGTAGKLTAIHIRFEDYTDLGNGIWFPKEITRQEVLSDDSGYTFRLQANSVSTADFLKESLIIPISKDADVTPLQNCTR